MQRILVIDDSSSDRRLLRDALESEGCSVEEAADGAEGLAGRSPPKLMVPPEWQRPSVRLLEPLGPLLLGHTPQSAVRTSQGNALEVILTTLSVT